MKVINQGGDTTLIRSDTDWKSIDQPPASDWTTVGYNDEDWKGVKNYGSKHWDQLVALTFDDAPESFARASLVQQHPFMKALGRPTRENVATTRADQATLLQALELTNGEYFNGVLAEGAGRWLNQYHGKSEELATELYYRAFGRAPADKELKIMIETLGNSPDQATVQDLLWATVLSPEFQFIQ
jgi:hypothetical protein